MVYYKHEPFGEYPAFVRAGIVASTMANLWRGKGRPAYKVEDFMPKDLVSGPKKQTVAEQREILKMLARQFGAQEGEKKVSPKGKKTAKDKSKDKGRTSP